MKKIDWEKDFFFLGSSRRTIDEIKHKCSLEFPNIPFGSFVDSSKWNGVLLFCSINFLNLSMHPCARHHNVQKVHLVF